METNSHMYKIFPKEEGSHARESLERMVWDNPNLKFDERSVTFASSILPSFDSETLGGVPHALYRLFRVRKDKVEIVYLMSFNKGSSVDSNI